MFLCSQLLRLEELYALSFLTHLVRIRRFLFVNSGKGPVVRLTGTVANKQVKSRERPYCWDVPADTDQIVLREET